ncbi:bifunctional UDP-N-acetylglucosamine diphosphorylase/glucosamine-1-phosphate N-acetyltransferase GlmU [Tissierella creatinini]|nr:bifunctional UDP-N-acetylglucosamine diphosphorylase/glucosamine-1-phosphate N-acetyltransferase GlmU [Tissierella creatinini]TJX62393.1 bifunctional UDP-N-acetylglucosamine diphosphorylase/glucosamine-1-phosphate N-acetyltransferase GlmU [Soehngenia saccharolytica]
MNISIILAAGEGTRMKSKEPKVLHKICNKPLLEYVLNACKKADIDKNIVITGHGKDKVVSNFNDETIVFRDQPIYEGAPYGTGFAVIQALDEISDESIVTILCGDTPLITEKTLTKLMDYHKKGEFKGTVLTAVLEDATGYGRIIRKKSGEIERIVEQKDANEEELLVREVNSGMYCFEGKSLKDALKKIGNNNAQNEYYLTDVISIMNENGQKVGACIIDDSKEIQGVNNRVQLSQCELEMRRRINNNLMLSGVTLIDPSTTYIGENVRIGRDTVIYPGCILEGNTVIGEDCIIRSNTRIFDSKIGDGVDIESSLIESSVVEEGSHIGPYAHLRPKSHLGKHVKVGNFVEVKNATLGNDTKASHLSYVGDADVGNNVNIGCGVVFVNYNGREKFRSNIADNAFIGSNSNIVAPINVKEWGYIAAGSTITEDVGEGDLSIARARQVNKPGWVEAKGLKKHK